MLCTSGAASCRPVMLMKLLFAVGHCVFRSFDPDISERDLSPFNASGREHHADRALRD